MTNQINTTTKKGSMKKKYIPVPVKAAKEIAEKYDKAIVIVNTWDTTNGLLHTTTYGASEAQKLQAAKGGDIAAKALGADMPRADFYEDFRKEQVKILESAKDALRSYQYGNSSPDLAKEIADSIESFIEKHKD